MKSELKVISPTHKEIHLEIDGQSLKEAYGRVSQKYSKLAVVPGFRKGYAPVDVVRLRYKEEIKSEVLQDVVPTHVAAAIEEHDLDPLRKPHLHLVDHDAIKVNGSQPITIHVHVEVMPEIPEPKYEGIEVGRSVKPVDASEVEDLIAERLQKEAALIPVEGRSSEVGDTVMVDLEGRFDDTPDADPITASDLEIVLGDEVIEKSFTENLVGVKSEEEKEFTVVYPAEFSSAALAGKTVHYKAKVKSVGKTEVPERNDEWAKSLDEGYSSLADLRERLLADLTKFSEADADARVRNDVIAKLIENNTFEVPNTLIENQARNLLNNFAQDLQQRGIDVNKVENEFIKMAYGNMRTQAERDVMGSLLLDKVAEAEKVVVSDSEVDEEIEKMAGYYRASTGEVRESLEKQGGGVDSIKNNLKTRKTIEAVVAKAKVTDGPWTDETAVDEAADKKPKKAAKSKAPQKKAAEKA
ncbi:trigger factor [soil metagenome]